MCVCMYVCVYISRAITKTSKEIKTKPWVVVVVKQRWLWCRAAYTDSCPSKNSPCTASCSQCNNTVVVSVGHQAARQMPILDTPKQHDLILCWMLNDITLLTHLFSGEILWYFTPREDKVYCRVNIHSQISRYFGNPSRRF